MFARKHAVRIEDFGQLREVWPGTTPSPVQLSPGPLQFSLTGVQSDSFGIMKLMLAPRTSDLIFIDDNRTNFVLAERPTTLCGVEVKPPSLLILRSGREYRSILEPNFRSLEFFCTNDVLEDYPLGDLLAGGDCRPEPFIVPLSQTQARKIRAAAVAHMRSPDGSAELDDPDLDQATQCRVLALLSGIVQDSMQREGDSLMRSSTSALALEALDIIDQQGPADVQLCEIYKSLGVSRRALEKSFASVVGVSPGQYLLANRLNLARSGLADTSRRVSDCLYDAGLMDGSRAARQYRRLFGELPSMTLKRSNAVAP